MVTVMMNNGKALCIHATELRLKGNYVTALSNGKVVGVFCATEIIGCWTGGGSINNVC